MENAIEVRKTAEQYFKSGLLCAESVALAIAKAHGIESDVLPKAATAFCSGMARTCGPCGALTGAVLGVGLVLGRSSSAESIEACYLATRRLIQMFETEFGSRDCYTLLDGCDLNTPAGQAEFKEKKFGYRCLQFTGGAAEMAESVISARDG
jgi:C_GCAxxG_C_C family probable redox protein